MQIEELCTKITTEMSKLTSEVTTVKAEMSHIKEVMGTLTNEVRSIKDQRYENGIAKEKMAGTINTLEKTFVDHVKQQNEKDKVSSQRNWGLWMLIIGVVVSGIAGWLFALFKG